MEGKKFKRKLSYILVFLIIFTLINSIASYAFFEDKEFLEVTRISDGESAVLLEERDITYKITGNEYSLVVDENILVPKEIMLVIDISGSMGWQIGGGDRRKRLDVLKTAATNFIDKFAGKNVKIAYTKYSSAAYNPSTMHDLKKPADVISLKNRINELSANGSTNIGDGIRRGYYDLVNTPNDDVMKYMIVMTDGEPNYFTSNSKIRKYYSNDYYNYDNYMKLSDGQALYKYGQNGSHGLSYAKKTANLIKNNDDIGSYVVGFSSGSSDYQLETIGESAGARINDETGKHFYKALTGDEIVNIYANIAQEIDSELGFESAVFSEILPLGVEPVTDNLPEGFGVTLLDDGRYKIIGDVNNLKLVKLENGNYKVEDKEIKLRVKFNSVGLKEFGIDEGKIDYVDPFSNNKSTSFVGQFDVLVGNPVNGISDMDDLSVEKGKTEKVTITVDRGDNSDIENTDFDVEAEVILAEGNTNKEDLNKVSIDSIVKNDDGTIDLFVKGLDIIDFDKIKLKVYVNDNVVDKTYKQECNVSVYAKLSSIGDLKDLKIEKNSTKKVSVDILPKEALAVEYKWKTDDDSILELDGKSFNTYYDYDGSGKIEVDVKGIKNGSTKLKIVVQDLYSQLPLEKDCNVQVGESVSDVGQLYNDNIPKGTTKEFKINIDPDTASDVKYKWMSEDGIELIGIDKDKFYDYDGSGVIKVNVKGNVGGDAKLSVVVVDDFSETEYLRDCIVHVYTPLTSVTLPTDIAIKKGTNEFAIAELNPIDASDYSYNWEIVEGSSNIKIVSEIDIDGFIKAEIKGEKIGKAKIKFTIQDTNTDEMLPVKYVNVEVGVPIDSVGDMVNVSMNQNKEKIVSIKISPNDVPITKDNIVIALGDGTIAEAEIVETQGDILVDGVLKIKVKGLKPGETKLNVKITDNFDYDLDGELNVFEKSCLVKVWNVDIQ